MESDALSWYIGLALGIVIVYCFIKWVKIYHIFFAVLYVAGAIASALGGVLLAWPVTHNVGIPMLGGALLWTGLILYGFLHDRS